MFAWIVTYQEVYKIPRHTHTATLSDLHSPYRRANPQQRPTLLGIPTLDLVREPDAVEPTLCHPHRRKMARLVFNLVETRVAARFQGPLHVLSRTLEVAIIIASLRTEKRKLPSLADQARIAVLRRSCRGEK